MELIDYGTRWYDPQIGRFISPDTIIPDPQNPQNFNRYAYVLGNPLKFVDPSGHCGVNSDETAKMLMDSGCSGTSGKRVTAWAGHSVDVTYERYGYPGKPPISPILRDAASTASTILETVELGVSTVGVVGQYTPIPFVEELESMAADEAETAISVIDTAANVFGDLMGGRNYFDGATNEIVMGEGTAIALTDQILDSWIPASPKADLILNGASYFLHGDPILEVRLSNSRVNVVIYQEALAKDAARVYNPVESNLRPFHESFQEWWHQGEKQRCYPNC